ncbi:unnamed protein product [Oncorhynchus mykiss]|uniref:EMI domain-containing protein n=1 Tax=Oncorhynchus mykiss TaxID=8022 RepID=A0A060XJW7_ONCMY|nr:unnamed protein product [Oncorhynchus mykiss]
MGACQRDVVSALCRKSFRWIVLLLWLTSAAHATWRTGLYKYSAGTQLNRESSAASQTSIYQKRNWCPHTVTKTVTCQVQNGTTLQRVYQTCRWPQGCTGGSYRTVVRPSYKVVYRTINSLEWKCCPGYSGTACEEGKRATEVNIFWDLCTYRFLCSSPAEHISVHLCTSLYFSVLLCTSLYFFVLLCTSLYISVHLCTSLYFSVHLCISLYISVHLCTSLYFSVLLCTSLYFSVHLCTSLYFSVLLCTSLYFSVLLCTSLCFSVLLCTSLYISVLLCKSLYFSSFWSL